MFRILLVDDFQTMRSATRRMLSQLGLTQVVEASDGRKALSVLAAGEVDGVITDSDMPNLSGLEFVHELRRRPEWRSLPVVMMSASTDRAAVQAAAEAGIQGYLVKPFDHTELARQIRKAFRIDPEELAIDR